MITLYQLHWSHYVEKVAGHWTSRASSGRPLTSIRFQSGKCVTSSASDIVPTIHDQTTGAMLGESTSIIEYLEQTCPTPPLYAGNRDEIKRWMLWLDSTLGLGARRLAYTQLALEYPGYLPSLFLQRCLRGNQSQHSGKNHCGRPDAAVSIPGYNRADGVFEQVEQCCCSQRSD